MYIVFHKWLIVYQEKRTTRCLLERYHPNSWHQKPHDNNKPDVYMFSALMSPLLCVSTAKVSVNRIVSGNDAVDVTMIENIVSRYPKRENG